jgi:hypothetical protein
MGINQISLSLKYANFSSAHNSHDVRHGLVTLVPAVDQITIHAEGD